LRRWSRTSWTSSRTDVNSHHYAHIYTVGSITPAMPQRGIDALRRSVWASSVAASQSPIATGSLSVSPRSPSLMVIQTNRVMSHDEWDAPTRGQAWWVGPVVTISHEQAQPALTGRHGRHNSDAATNPTTPATAVALPNRRPSGAPAPWHRPRGTPHPRRPPPAGRRPEPAHWMPQPPPPARWRRTASRSAASR
jgi:hypothetical protein